MQVWSSDKKRGERRGESGPECKIIGVIPTLPASGLQKIKMDHGFLPDAAIYS
jgi:hypothetical protein